MVKLTAELIQNCQQRINPVKDRELDLRGTLSLAIIIIIMSFVNL